MTFRTETGRRATRPGRQTKRRGSALGDVAVGLVLLALLFGAALPVAGSRSREQANRIKCASNLRQIGLAMLMYSNDNKGYFPRAVFSNKANPTPTEYTGVQAPNPFAPGGPAPDDVTAAMFLLLRTQDITPEAFVCSS